MTVEAKDILDKKKYGEYIRKIPVILLAVLLTCSGCATVRHPVPPDLVMKARIEGMDDVRIVMGEHYTKLQENLLFAIKQESAEDFPAGEAGERIYSILLLSGGGAYGAYGAGLLKGWSFEGSRPTFKIVTGVSTGAIIAPFAFLGREYDDELEKYYTTMSTKDVLRENFPLTDIFGNSLASNRPLARKIAVMFDRDFVVRIAEENKRGRRLFVSTSDLDSARLVIWDMGAIAARGDIELFRKVILTSAAIPVVFSPTIFHVMADGGMYDEMHADGGTITQAFTTYQLLEGMEGAAKAMGIDPSKVKSRLYLILNDYMSPPYKKVQDSLMPIAERSLNILIDAQGLGDVYRIYLFVKERGGDYNLAYIPPDFKDDSREMFDRRMMKRLFQRGYEDAVRTYNWRKAPPGVDGS